MSPVCVICDTPVPQGACFIVLYGDYKPSEDVFIATRREGLVHSSCLDEQATGEIRVDGMRIRTK